jgi:hypothetical protein
MVSTPKKVAANHANAAKSTGPRTEEGKARVAENSLTHGLRSSSVVMPWESQEEFDDFSQRMLACLGPADELERMLAERVVVEAWRVRRAGAYEARAFRAEFKVQRSGHRNDPLKYRGLPDPNTNVVIRAMLADLLPKLSAYQQRIETSLFRYLHEFERAQASRPAPRPAAPAGQGPTTA